MELRITRRAALGAAASTLALPAAAADFRPLVPSLRLGANLERWFPIAAGQRARRLGRGWWEEFRAAGFDHARMFIPKDAGDGEEVPRLFLQAVEDANAAGLPVLLGLSDLFAEWEPWEEGMWRTVRSRAQFFAQATDPASVALAPLNEPAFRTAAAWTPVRDRLLSQTRTAAAQHTLVWGGHEWCSWRSLPPQPPPSDPNTVAEVHDYEGGDARWVAQRFGEVARWGERHRRRVMVTELGGALANGGDEAAWAADLSRSLPELRRLGLPVTLWAVTHGGSWRLQEGEGPAPRGRLAAALRAARQ